MSQASCSLKLLNIFTTLDTRFIVILSHTEDFEKSAFIEDKISTGDEPVLSREGDINRSLEDVKTAGRH
jgi:hypothetical protein